MTSHNGGCLSSLLKAVNVIIQCIRTVCTALQYIVSTANYFFPFIVHSGNFLTILLCVNSTTVCWDGTVCSLLLPIHWQKGRKATQEKTIIVRNIFTL